MAGNPKTPPTVVALSDDPQFTQKIESTRRSAAGGNVVLDFSAVRYLTSANLALLLVLRKELAAGDHQVRLCSVASQVWAVFVVTGLNQLFDVSADVDQAIAAMAK